MSKSYYWLCKDEGIIEVEEWIKDNGGNILCAADSSNRYIIHFDKIGPLSYLDNSSLALSEGQSWREQKQVILNRMSFEKYPNINIIDSDRSPVALYVKPFLKDSMFLTFGELHFLPARLNLTFPELNKICGRFGRYISKQKLIYDNTKIDNINEYEYYLEHLGIVRKIFAYPDALQGLEKGEYFLDSGVTDIKYYQWLKTLRLRGVRVPDFT